jgi:hypothetical protein
MSNNWHLGLEWFKDLLRSWSDNVGQTSILVRESAYWHPTYTYYGITATWLKRMTYESRQASIYVKAWNKWHDVSNLLQKFQELLPNTHTWQPRLIHKSDAKYKEIIQNCYSTWWLQILVLFMHACMLHMGEHLFKIQTIKLFLFNKIHISVRGRLVGKVSWVRYPSMTTILTSHFTSIALSCDWDVKPRSV